MMKYRQLTGHSPTGIIIVEQGIIRYANPSFMVFSGYALPELIGRDLELYIDEKNREEFSGFRKQWSAVPNKPANGEFRFVNKSGSLHIAALFTVPIMHFGKAATLINVIDNSEKWRLTEKLQEDNERRRGIIVTLAHELQTPLQPIFGYLNLLIQDPEGVDIKGDTKKILERCLSSVDRERQIVNQMLELSILESGKLNLKHSTFSLVTLVKSVMDARCFAADAEINLEIPPDWVVSADMDRLYVVFDSIISNAINYSTAPRKIRISYHSDPGDSMHHIAIRDNGIDIEEEALSSVFEPFQLPDAVNLSRKFERIGLSLSIAKKIAQMHGGDIAVESTVNVGSTFTIHLPKEGGEKCPIRSRSLKMTSPS